MKARPILILGNHVVQEFIAIKITQHLKNLKQQLLMAY